MILKT